MTERTTNEPNRNDRQRKRSEAEFLPDAQAANAQAAIHETWNELKGTLGEAATLEVWARRHPWIVAGAAAAGGFLIATTVLRPKDEPPNSQPDMPQQTTGSRPGANWLIETVFGLLKPVLGQLATALVAAAMGAVGGAVSETAGKQETDGSDPGWPQDNGGQSGEGPVPA